MGGGGGALMGFYCALGTLALRLSLYLDPTPTPVSQFCVFGV